MKRFLSSFFALAMCASLGTAAIASSMSGHSSVHKHSCAKGQTYVHGYMKNGKHVKGYCRKSAM